MLWKVRGRINVLEKSEQLVEYTVNISPSFWSSFSMSGLPTFIMAAFSLSALQDFINFTGFPFESGDEGGEKEQS